MCGTTATNSTKKRMREIDTSTDDVPSTDPLRWAFMPDDVAIPSIPFTASTMRALLPFIAAHRDAGCVSAHHLVLGSISCAGIATK
jgi:hypothetical protein